MLNTVDHVINFDSAHILFGVTGIHKFSTIQNSQQKSFKLLTYLFTRRIANLFIFEVGNKEL